MDLRLHGGVESPQLPNANWRANFHRGIIGQVAGRHSSEPTVDTKSQSRIRWEHIVTQGLADAYSNKVTSRQKKMKIKGKDLGELRNGCRKRE